MTRCMKVNWGILFLTWATCAIAADRALDECVSALRRVPAFETGNVTDRGESPEHFFRAIESPDGRRRSVLLVGAPGAGKSFWSSAAEKAGWAIVENDRLRDQMLRRWRAENKTIEVVREGTKRSELVDPKDPVHVMAHETVWAMVDESWRALDRAITERKPVVLEASGTFLGPLRALRLHRLRLAGYFTEGLVFHGASAEDNVANVLLREAGGDLRRVDPALVRQRYDDLRFFSARFRVDPAFVSRPSREFPAIMKTVIFDLPRHFPTLEAARAGLPQDQRKALDAYESEDVFHDLRFVWTPRFGRKSLPLFTADPPALPHDSPLLRERTRLYVAVTNQCNRECPWCSVYSSPRKNTFLQPEQMAAHFPADRDFDVQLEGGEPTIHPKLFDFVDVARRHPRMRELVLVTNGVKLPRDPEGLKAYLARFGEPFKVKLSINHHLLEHDPGLVATALRVREAFRAMGGRRELILNVRLRRGEKYGDDAWVQDAVEKAGLLPLANVFFLQRYGRGETEEDWKDPFVVTEDFLLVNPDGSAQGTDLIARGKAMGDMP